jgi:U4/U6 small nuclear ribonucleoprotein PRP31
MSALADELTADFAELEDQELDEYDEGEQEDPTTINTVVDRDGDAEMSDGEGEDTEITDGPNALNEKGVMPGGVQPAEQLDPATVQRMELSSVGDVSKVARLFGSKKMNDVIKVFFPSGWLAIIDI